MGYTPYLLIHAQRHDMIRAHIRSGLNVNLSLVRLSIKHGAW